MLRPGQKNGATTLIFRLSQPSVLRITIVRVYPSCERVGSFTVRAHAGVNRIRFRGRFRGRTLPTGGYRLVVRARGAQRDAAAIPIVVARGQASKAALRKARSGGPCSAKMENIGFVSAAGADGSGSEHGQGGSDGGRLASIAAPITGAGGAVAGAIGSIPDRVTEAMEGKPLNDPFVLTVIGLLLLVIASLGALLLAQAVRALDEHDRRAA